MLAFHRHHKSLTALVAESTSVDNWPEATRSDIVNGKWKHDDRSWCTTQKGITEAFMTPDQDVMRKIREGTRKIKGALSAPHAGMVRAISRDLDDGVELQPDRYLVGDADRLWIDRKVRKVAGKRIRILLDAAGNCGVDTIQPRIVAGLSLVEALATRKIESELFLGWTSKGTYIGRDAPKYGFATVRVATSLSHNLGVLSTISEIRWCRATLLRALCRSPWPLAIGLGTTPRELDPDVLALAKVDVVVPPTIFSQADCLAWLQHEQERLTR